jgi:hypothetical protein
LRFYNLILQPPGSAQIWQPTPTGDGFTLGTVGSTFTSFAPGPGGVGGQSIPGALDIEFDSIITPWDVIQGGTKITIWGVGLGMISQAANLNGSSFLLIAGMKPGLPLATLAYNAGQGGPIARGTIYQAYGNWQATNQSLELICNPGVVLPPLENISLSWQRGQPLSSALATTLYNAFHSLGFQISTNNISSLLVPKSTQTGIYNTLQSFASWLTPFTKALGAPTYGKSYGGVQIVINGNQISAYDGQGPVIAKTIPLAFNDMIGQPTWLSATEVSVKTMLRADIQTGNFITFPPGIQSPYALTTSGVAYPNVPAASKTAFQGKFFVNEIHQFAHFRQPDADSWATAIRMAAVGTTGTPAAPTVL